MLEFDRFFGSEYGRVVRSLTLALGDQGRAEEAAEEAIAHASRRWRSVGVMDRPGAWVYVVALRAERRRLSRAARQDSNLAVAVDPDGEEGMVDGLWVTAALDGLTDRQRLAVVLRYYADLSLADTAEAMGCALGTVKATLHAALGRMRVAMVEGAEVSDAH